MVLPPSDQATLYRIEIRGAKHNVNAFLMTRRPDFTRSPGDGAILHVVAQSLEEAFAQLRPGDGAQADGLARRFALLYGFVKSHEDVEEARVAVFACMKGRRH